MSTVTPADRRTRPAPSAARAAPGPHAPVAHQRREADRWVLEGELPEPTWYF
ncbi:hypothetical protein [Streptomyces sp. NPDC050287]|uniref:hypothetical protein n=1 Tax=Streptomyces sp. NPDC050287 TaxID=3365608 RepID=UPI00378E3B3D